MRAYEDLARAILASLVLGMVACGDDDDEGGSACTVEQDDGGGRATITCDDGTSAVVEDGKPGGCTIEQKGDTRTIRCADGTEIEVVGSKGQDGEDGEDGAPGADGTNGTNGTDGMDGEPGAPGTNGTDGSNGTNGTSAGVIGAGLEVEVSSVTIPADLRPVVSLSIKDDQGHALDRAGITTPGSVSVSFVLAYLSSSGGVVGQYVPYNTATVTGKTVKGVPPALASALQPKSDSGGTWTVVDAAAGTYTYRFGAALPAGYDGSKTHTLAVFAARTFQGVQYADDPSHHFRPDGAAVSERREIVATETCNKCHDSLRVHGGSRFELGLCSTCHVDGMNDPESGNSLDLRQMVHKIHRGRNLPSVLGNLPGGTPTPYRIIGYGDSEHDYSDIVFPQAMENCQTCHQGAPDSGNWKTHMSRAACGSCHDRTSFASGAAPAGFVKHTAGQQDDTQCIGCHEETREPIGVAEVDVTRVHVPREKWPLRDGTGAVVSQAPVVTGSIQSVTATSAQPPVVTFRVQVNGQPHDLLASGNALSTLRFTFAAPTTDYAGYAQYTAQSVTGGVPNNTTIAATGTAGEFTWTAPQTIENIASGNGAANGWQPFPLTGTMAVGMEGRLTRPATQPDGTQVTAVNYPMHNDVFYVALTDANAVPRRVATVVENCNTCHGDLRAHGGSRNDPEYCVMCHSAGRDSITRMTAPTGGDLARTTSLRMSHMVHRFHMGEEGARPYFDAEELRFPGDPRNCTHCHVPGQYGLPLASGLLTTRTSDIDSTRARVKNYFMGATAAACTGCHDAESVEVHAATMSVVQAAAPNTTPAISESCATCHADGKEFGLDIVHAHPAP